MIGKTISLIIGIELKTPIAKNASAMAVEGEKIFEQTYGSIHVPFFHGSLEQAKKEAKEKDALLIACFYSRHHESTDAFLKKTIADPRLADLLESERIIFWFSDVYHTSSYECKLHSFKNSFIPAVDAMLLGVQELPALVFMAKVDHRLIILKMIQGFCTATILGDVSMDLLSRLEMHSIAVQERASDISLSQRLREDQDAAYQRSLEADAKKAREREEQEQLLQEEQEQREKEEDIITAMHNERATLLNNLKMELPEECESPEAVKISLQLLDGSRVIRKFSPNNRLTDLYNWAFSILGGNIDISLDDIAIRTMMPPVIFANSEENLLNAGIQSNMKLIVILREQEGDE